MASKFLRRLLLGILLLCALLAAAGGWLLGTEQAARWILSAAVGHGLQLSGISGRLAGPLRVTQIRWQNKGQDLLLDDALLDWQLADLLHGQLHVRELRAKRLVVLSKVQPDDAPLLPPKTLALPLRLQVDRLQVDQGELRWGPVSVIRLGGFSTGVNFDGRLYHLQLQQFSASGAAEQNSLAAQLTGRLQLDSQSPFALEAELHSGGKATLQNKNLAVKGELQLRGSLMELRAALDFSLGAASLQGGAMLQPFAALPLASADLRAQDIDLSALYSTLPQTRLSGRLKTTGPQSGELDLQNHDARSWDQHGLPLRTLQLATRREGARLLFDQVSATFGSEKTPAGSLHGSGAWQDGGLKLAVAVQELNLRGLDQRALATRLAGKIAFEQRANGQAVQLDVSEPFGKQNLAIKTSLLLSRDALAIEQADILLAGGRLQASGKVALAGTGEFSAQGDFSKFRLQDLGRFDKLPALVLNGHFAVQGARAPQLVADLDFNIHDSSLAGQPLQGQGQARLRGERLLVPALALSAGANQLQVQGELAQDSGQLDFTLKAPQLDMLGAGFGGALDVAGHARGKLSALQLEANWSGSKISVPGGYRLEKISGKTSFAPQPEAPLLLALQVDGISTPQLKADSLAVAAQGSTARHSITATLLEGSDRSEKQAWKMALQGGLQMRDAQNKAGPRWQGEITQFEASGRFAAQLAAPAPLALSAATVELKQFRLNAGSTALVLEQFQREQNLISTRGQLKGLKLAQVLGFASAQPAISTDLVLDGEWDLQLGDGLRGKLGLRRVAGDVQMRGGGPVSLGVRTLEATADAAADGVRLHVLAEGAQLGRIEVDAKTSGSGRALFAGESGLSGKAVVVIPSLHWLGPLLSTTLQTEGQLAGSLTVAGSVANPQFEGALQGHKLRAFLGDSGIDLREGELAADFSGDTLQLKQLRFQSSGGSLSASGPLYFADGKAGAQIAVRAERYPLLNRSDRKLVLSGQAQLDWQDKRAKVGGALTVDSGAFDLGRTETPELSDDVVVLGAAPKTATPLALALDMNLDLGKGVALRGRGLEGQLLGALRISSEAGSRLRARGTLSISDGTYTAYGRKLAIETGELRFNGPLDNPALDITAMRRGQDVEAGVAVRGSVLTPRVTLVSEPTVPDAEKLSWLVLGHGLDNAANADVGALQAAAGALLSDGAAAGVQGQLANTFGLTDFKIGSTTTADNLQQRIVTLGKRVSARLYVSYQQSLQSVGSVVLLRYTLTPHLTIEAEAGTRSAISLLYNLSFD